MKAYTSCVTHTDKKSEVKLDLITATAAVAAFSSILFGLFTNLPVCLG